MICYDVTMTSQHWHGAVITVSLQCKPAAVFVGTNKGGAGTTCLFTRLESSLVPAGFLTAQFLQKL